MPGLGVLGFLVGFRVSGILLVFFNYIKVSFRGTR